MKQGVKPEAEVFILQPEVNGIQEITRILENYAQVQSLHIVTHGVPGEIYLGENKLNLQTLTEYSADLQRWSVAEILLYGCNVAAGDAGEEFIGKLHQITKAVISASATKTGNPALGGNWELEVKLPAQDGTTLAFGQEILNTYQGIFAPSLVGGYHTGGYTESIQVLGNYAYIADGDKGLQIYDISNPANPILKGSNSNPNGYARGIQVVGNYAYVAYYGTGLQIVDISDPTNPTVKSNYYLPSLSGGLQIVGNYAYVTDFYQSEQIIDISNPANPTFKGSYNAPSQTCDVRVVGNYAYVADAHNGLQIYDISNPACPTFKGSYDTPGIAVRVQVVGNYAYVADYNQGLQIIDISNPACPTLKGSYYTNDLTFGIEVVGEYAYVTSINTALQIFDISNPANPILKGTCTTNGYGLMVQIVSNYAYVADSFGGFKIIDVSEFSNYLQGTSGDDTFIGTSGKDNIIGGDGYDTVDYSQLATQITLKPAGIIDKGALGIDTVQAEVFIGNSAFANLIDASSSSTNAINVNLSANFLNVFGLPLGNISFDVYNFTDVKGSQLADEIIGDEKNNVLEGQGGNDLIFATTGNDTIIGGDGFDTVNYSYVDSAITLKTQGVIFKATGGTDTVQVENIIGNASYRNTIDAASSTTNGINADLSLNSLTVFNLPSGNTTFQVFNFQDVTGSQVSDVIKGNSGNNALKGEGGDDTLIGGFGGDILDGATGTDTASYLGSTAGVTVNLATGIASGGDASGDYFLSIENVTGSAFNDLLTGNTLNNILDGGDGNDTLIGDAGNDILIGGAGSDSLTGGAGNDSLTGGAGNDFFRFNNKTDGIDTITDFSVVDDKITLLASGFGGLSVGTLSTSAFVIGSTTTNFAQRLIYNSTNGELWFDRDGIATTFSTIKLANLSSGLALTNANFQIV